jgi:hypothetical protein
MSGYKGTIHLLYGYLCSARWLVFGYFPDELRRMHLPRTPPDKRGTIFPLAGSA